MRFSPMNWWAFARRQWLLKQLALPDFGFMFDPAPENEWVSIDCETTGLDIYKDEIISIGAVRIVGNKLMTSERLELLVRTEKKLNAESVKIHRLRQKDLEQGLCIDDAVKKLMHFIGSRPLVGYYLEFDMAMLNRAIRPLLHIGLPQPKIEVSGLYHDYKFRQLSPHRQHAADAIDLRFATLMNDLGLPMQPAHDALNDAVMAGLAFIKLRHLMQL
jgi:DNA polymerase-3 subunit epsilon